MLTVKLNTTLSSETKFAIAKSENPNADVIAYVSQYSLDDAVNSKQVAVITHIQNGQAVAVDGTEYTYFIPVISVVK